MENNDLKEQNVQNNEIEDVHSNKIIEFDKINHSSNNAMVDIDEKILKQLENDEKTQENVVSFEEPIIPPIQIEEKQNPIPQNNIQQYVTNGGLTIHQPNTLPKEVDKKKKRLNIILISCFSILLFFIGGYFALDYFEIINKETIDDIYASYSYNYTNDIIKVYFDGEKDIYFIEDDNANVYNFVDNKNKDNYVMIYLNNDISFEKLKEKYEIISNEESYQEIGKTITINHNIFTTKMDNSNFKIMMKEVIIDGKSFFVFMQLEENVNNSTLENIYKTINIM